MPRRYWQPDSGRWVNWVMPADDRSNDAAFWTFVGVIGTVDEKFCLVDLVMSAKMPTFASQ